MAQTNLPATGAVGVEPPPDAPRETSQPLQADYIAQAQARARQNERTLAPLTATGPKPGEVGPEAVETDPHEVQAPKPVQAAPNYPAPPSKYVEARSVNEFPAGSNSDSPTRGVPGTAPVPASRSKAPLQVVGGFGEAQAEYYPLDGREVYALCCLLMDKLQQQIENDLRFGIAITYPRIAATLTLKIEGEADDQTVLIEKKHVHDKTPLEVAQQYADSVVFVVKQQRREFDEHGEVETPPDGMRDEMQLRKPRKQRTGGPLGQVSDVTW